MISFFLSKVFPSRFGWCCSSGRWDRPVATVTMQCDIRITSLVSEDARSCIHNETICMVSLWCFGELLVSHEYSILIMLFLQQHYRLCILNKRSPCLWVVEFMFDYCSWIFCAGGILHAVQLSSIFSDSKTLGDRLLRVSPDEALPAFAALGPVSNITETPLRLFVKDYFDPAGSDLMIVSPADYKPVAEGGLPVCWEIRNPGLQQSAGEVHSRWRDLGREVSKSQ